MMKVTDTTTDTTTTTTTTTPTTYQVIAAEGEQKASRALKEAADVIQESPQALQVIIFYFSCIEQKRTLDINY